MSFITVFGTLSFPISILSRFCFRSWYSTLNGLDLNLETRRYVPVSGHELKFWGRPHRPLAVRIDAAFSCTSHAAWSVREARGWAIQNGWTDRNVDCRSDLFGREDLVLERRTYLLRGKGKVHVPVHFQSRPRLLCGGDAALHQITMATCFSKMNYAVRSALICSVLKPSSIRGLATSWTFIIVLCRSDWLFHGESCPRLDVVHPGRAHIKTQKYDTRCNFNVRWKADTSQINLAHATNK